MTRYYFDLYEDDEALDEEGRECETPESALALAVLYARDIAAAEVRSGRLNLNHSVAVRDGLGKPVGRVTFEEAIALQR